MRVHFQTTPSEHAVFHMPAGLVAEAAARAGVPSDLVLTTSEGAADLRDAVGLVCSQGVVAEPAFRAALPAGLRWIHITGAGIERLLPLDWLPGGVVLTNNSGVHVARTAEFATMALLMLAAGMPAMIGHQRERRWIPVFTRSIVGQTLLVVGLGDMGGAAAGAARRLGMRVVGIRRSGASHPAADVMLPMSALHRGLAEADQVLIAAPLTAETRHLIDASAIAAMKVGAGLINIARAAIVDTEALCAALRSGHLGGAIVDVFDPEPLPAASPLWDTPRLVITPHCSSDDLDAYMPLTLDLVFENLIRLRAGAALKNVVDPARGY